jgi:hypothetical protein
MPARFNKMGVVFQYPENWTLDEQTADGGEQSITVYNPGGGGFWTLSVHPRGADPRRLASAALMAMKEEYENLDSEAVHEKRQDHELVGYDLNFYCLDLTNSAVVRTLRTERASYTIFYQAEDREFDAIHPVFEAMTMSFLTHLAKSAEPHA